MIARVSIASLKGLKPIHITSGSLLRHLTEADRLNIYKLVSTFKVPTFNNKTELTSVVISVEDNNVIWIICIYGSSRITVASLKNQ